MSRFSWYPDEHTLTEPHHSANRSSRSVISSFQAIDSAERIAVKSEIGSSAPGRADGQVTWVCWSDKRALTQTTKQSTETCKSLNDHR